MNNRETLIAYLQLRPVYHYGLDLSAATGIRRSKLYSLLGDLELERIVDRRDVPSGLCFPRPQYRIAAGWDANGAPAMDTPEGGGLSCESRGRTDDRGQ